MKAIKKLVFICLASILGLCSACMNDNPDFGRDDEGTGNTNQGEGQVRLAGTSVSVSVDVLSRADGKAINTDDYIIRIYSTDNNLLVKEYTRYRDMPEILTLNVGNYKIEALSHDVKPAEWEKPFYKGTQTFTIKKDEVTSVDVIKCFLQNIMVTVDLNDDLKQKVGGDQSITIKVGTGELTFNNNDIGSGRAGFFEAAEVSNIIIVHFQGTVDGEWTEEQTSFSNVKGGEHRNIVFNLEIPSVGDMGLSVKLDAVCKKVDLLAWANPGAEDILPEDPSVNSGTSAPTIVGQGFNIMDEIEVEKDETKTIIVNITADNGIQNLKVKIDSETLTPEILKSVGLSSEFDLAHPANADLEKALKSLGFPVGSEVIGVKYLVFDITQFTPLLGLYGLASHNFIITVVDQANNTRTATLALKSIAKKTE